MPSVRFKEESPGHETMSFVMPSSVMPSHKFKFKEESFVQATHHHRRGFEESRGEKVKCHKIMGPSTSISKPESVIDEAERSRETTLGAHLAICSSHESFT
jgi:hypothetical protein